MSTDQEPQYRLEQEIGQKAINNILEIYVFPEIARRQESGQLEDPFYLYAAQIVFFPYNKPPDIRLNSEVKAIATFKYTGEEKKQSGELVFENEVEGIEQAFLTKEDDPDCGHVLLMLLNGQWNMYFDLRYNRDMANRHIMVAQQFVEAAEFSLKNEYWAAFVDTLFSAAELSAKATLLLHSLDLRTSKKHSAVRSKYNLFAHLGNIDSIHRDVFNRLSEWRPEARYATREFVLDETEAVSLLSTVEDMILKAKNLIEPDTLPSL